MSTVRHGDHVTRILKRGVVPAPRSASRAPALISRAGARERTRERAPPIQGQSGGLAGIRSPEVLEHRRRVHTRRAAPYLLGPADENRTLIALR